MTRSNVKAVLELEPFGSKKRIILLFCLLSFLFTLTVRCLDVRQWGHPALTMEVPGYNYTTDTEYIMGTHDAYYWLAGAERIGSATDSAMSIFLDVASRISKVPDGILAFWAPAVASSLVAVVGFLWGRLVGGTGVGLFTALLSGLFPGFYFRTRLGYYDTDIATLFFPLAVGFGLAFWLQPGIRIPWFKNLDTDVVSPMAGPYSLFWLGLFSAFGAWWHNDIGKFNLVAIWVAFFLILAVVRRELRGQSLLGLVVFTLAALGGWPGMLAALVMAWSMRTRPQWYAPIMPNFWIPAILVLLALTATGNLLSPAQYISAKILAYMKPITQEVGSSGTLVYPSITQSVVEAQNVQIQDILERMMPWSWLSIVGMVGLALLLVVRPVVMFLVPLVVLGFLSVKMGARMTMFGGPGVALGLGALFLWLLRWYLPKRLWNHWTEVLCPTVLGLCLLVPWLQLYLWTPPTPVLNKSHAMALTSLADLTTPNSQVWTWWDWGYATDYYAKRKSFADGGKHSGSRVFPVGLALITPSPLQSNQIIRYISAASKNGSDGSEEMSKQPPAEVQGFIDSLATVKYSFPKSNKQYLVVTWENFRLLYWISFYGSWNFKVKSGGHAQCIEITQAYTLDEKVGVITMKGRQPIVLSSYDRITPQGKVKQPYPTSSGPHFVYNEYVQNGFLMDDDAYNSMAVQLLLADVNDPRFTPYFHLIWEGFPEVRIYEVL